MNPPLHCEGDSTALNGRILNGTIDFIATDHAPHTGEEKGEGRRTRPIWDIGLETAFPLLYTYFVLKGISSL